MFARYGLLGVTLIVYSYLSTALDLPMYIIGRHALFVIGYWLLFDSLDYYVSKTSLLHKLKNKWRLAFYLVLGGIIFGVILDIFGIVVANLWDFYPGLSLTAAGSINVFKAYLFGYGIPILMYYSAYHFIYTLFKKEFKQVGVKVTSLKKEERIFRYIGLMGAVIFSIPILFYPYIKSLPNIYRGLSFALTLVGLWLILEHFEHKNKKPSLLKDILDGRWIPAFAIVVAAIVTGIAWEGLNVIRPEWNYINLPFSTITILSVPIWVILGWIPLFVIYLSFYRLLIKGRKREVW